MANLALLMALLHAIPCVPEEQISQSYVIGVIEPDGSGETKHQDKEINTLRW
jgi:hypothetical protein